MHGLQHFYAKICSCYSIFRDHFKGLSDHLSCPPVTLLNSGNQSMMCLLLLSHFTEKQIQFYMARSHDPELSTLGLGSTVLHCFTHSSGPCVRTGCVRHKKGQAFQMRGERWPAGPKRSQVEKDANFQPPASTPASGRCSHSCTCSQNTHNTLGLGSRSSPLYTEWGPDEHHSPSVSQPVAAWVWGSPRMLLI